MKCMFLALVLGLLLTACTGTASGNTWSQKDKAWFLDRGCISSEMDCTCALQEAERRWNADELRNTSTHDALKKALILQQACPRSRP